MSQSNTKIVNEQARILQLFRYVQAFNELQNPVTRDIQSQLWTLWFHDLPAHPCIEVQRPVDESDLLEEDSQLGEGEENANHEIVLLRVRRPVLTESPEPAKELLPWLQPDWQEADGNVTLVQGKSSQLHDDVRRTKIFQEWLARRKGWAEKELPARRTMDIFNKLYELRTRLNREAEQLELMVGDGILHWSPRGNSDASAIHHPILLLRLQLHFNPQVPEFTLTGTEQPSELYTALFQAMPEVNATDMGRSRQEFEQQHWHPLGGEATTAFLQRFVHQLSSKGKFSPQPIVPKDQTLPLITRDPVIFLRTRTLGFNTALEAILEDIPRRATLPDALVSLVGIRTNNEQQAVQEQERISSLMSPNGEDERILLSKAANTEQLEIARRLEHDSVVLVQGPPGTGKTHTIANLLGHLLAQGKSVLVTSQTSKALRVLHEKIVEPLQPLCVSMLDDDNRQQMERAIDAIAEKLSFARVEVLERNAASLTQHRLEMLRQLQTAREQLKAARNSEYQAIVIAGQSYGPAEAARYVAAHRETDAWIPTPVTFGVPCPLTLDELRELYHTNLTVTPQDEREMVPGLPEPQRLLSPVDFARLAEEYNQLRQTNLNYRQNLWHMISGSPASDVTMKLQELQQRLILALEPLHERVPWRLAALAAGREGGPRLQSWQDLISKIEVLYKLAANAEPMLLEYAPTVPDSYLTKHTEQVLSEIIGHLAPGGKLGRFDLLLHREWKTLIEQLRVKGQLPEIREHFVALLLLVQLNNARNELRDRWQRQMTVLGAPAPAELGAEPERACSQYVYQVRQCLEWYGQSWLPLERELQYSGLLWQNLLAQMPANLADYSGLQQLVDAVQEQLPPVLQAEINRRRFAANEVAWRDLQRQLPIANSPAAQVDVVQRLQKAIAARDAQQYQEAWQRLSVLHERQREREIRHVLLTKLAKSAPAWAAAIQHRQAQHGQGNVPERVEEAWHWQQLSSELERRGKVSLEELQERIAQLSQTLQKTTAELVENKAWAAQIRRTTVEQRQALLGWKEIMRKVGKGKGKRAPRLLAEARRKMPTCQSAVPVWIMPLSRVVQNFDPRLNRFDVVIVDEASQADIKALTTMYMGRQAVIVGDHEQVTPMAVGQRYDALHHLIDEHLQGIPNAEIYDGKLSIYSLAHTTFPPVCLREHFRCVSPIIEFSNRLSYHGKIKPLRDDSEVKLRPHTMAYRVKSSAVGKVNEEEAQTITALLLAASEQPEYRDATFGVISMVADEQAIRIDALLRQYLTPAAYAHHRVLSGSPPQFQGDERDVIFISMVDTADGKGPLTMRNEDANDYLYKKRFNVAASRARDQMWVVHSLDPEIDLKPGDIRLKLIQHAQNATSAAAKVAEQEPRVESEFERQVLKRLVQAGYCVTAQWPVGAYRIDLVVEGNGKRLAIECDGDRWHPLEKLEEDMARQAILERLGWRFVRIRGSQFFRFPEQAMEAVFARLRTLDIPPEGMAQTAIRPPTDDELKQRVIRRAVALRQQWSSKGR